jgi:hypothetical protein
MKIWESDLESNPLVPLLLTINGYVGSFETILLRVPRETGSLWTTDGGFGWTWSHDGIHVDAIHARTIVNVRLLSNNFQASSAGGRSHLTRP